MKKVLIITYYWPPAGGPGVQRVLKFANALPKMGWQPIILTVENPSSPAQDNSLLNSIPKECVVYKTKTSEPFALYKKFTGKKKEGAIPKDIIVQKKGDNLKERLARWVRANLFIPDARLGWVPHIVKEGMKIIEREKPDVIFSTSPPHSLQIGARKLAQKSGLKWIADFRDPWSEAYWESEIGKSLFAQKLNTRQELKTLKQATTVTTVSAGLVDLLKKKQTGNYHVLYNGFGQLNKQKVKRDHFNIIFIGNLSKYQNPLPFIKAFNQLPQEVRALCKVRFIGKVFDDYAPLLEQNGFILMDYMPYNKMMEYSQQASLLLLIFHETSYTQGYITAKMFDYLALRKPVLAIGTKNSIGEKVLNETESGALFEKTETTEMCRWMEKQFAQWKKEDALLLEPNSTLETYSTDYNVKKLITLFEGNHVE